MAHVDDRWFATVKGPDGKPVKHKTTRHPANGGNPKANRWRARYLDPDGRERNRSFDTRVKAERFLTEVEHSKIAGSYRDPDAGRVTLRKYAAEWAENYHPDTSRGVHVRTHLAVHIVPALGGHTLEHLAQRPSRIQAWLSALQLAPSAAGQVLITLSAIMRAAVDDGLIARNPCSAASVRLPKPPPRRVTPWTAAQVTTIRAALPARWRAVADCGAGLGLRAGEVFGLAEDAVEFLRRTVHVTRQVKRVNGRLWLSAPKGGRERDVPLPESVSLALAAHIAAHPPVSVTLPWNEPGTKRHGQMVTVRLLFSNPDGGPVVPSIFGGPVWRAARAAAGLDAGGPHQLRHFYASALLAGGVDIKALSEYLGHHDPAITLRIYAHLMPSAEGRALRAIEDALGEAAESASDEDHGPTTALDGENGP
jgi:integrase